MIMEVLRFFSCCSFMFLCSENVVFLYICYENHELVVEHDSCIVNVKFLVVLEVLFFYVMHYFVEGILKAILTLGREE